VVLRDPGGTAAALIESARAWRWRPLEVRRERWVAEEVCALAEEVHKLVAALRSWGLSAAAVQRSILAVRPGGIMAVRRRILYGSENRLWESARRWGRGGVERNPRPWVSAMRGPKRPAGRRWGCTPWPRTRLTTCSTDAGGE